MRVVVVGGGMAGLVLARALMAHGITTAVLERAPADTRAEGPIMLPFQAYEALDDLGLFDVVRAAGRDVAPGEDGRPVSIAVGRQELLEAVGEGVPGPLSKRLREIYISAVMPKD